MPAWNSATTSAAWISVFPAQAAAARRKKSAVQRPGGASYLADKDRRHTLKNGTNIGRRMGCQLRFYRGEATIHVDAVVGIADSRIQFREPLPALGVNLLQDFQPLQHFWLAHGHSLTSPIAARE